MKAFSDEDIKAALLAEAIALTYGVSPVEANSIKKSVVLHDIGKFAIPSYIINKPENLTSSEFAIMKTHTVLGANMLSGLRGDYKEMAIDICLCHHERYDKKGYWGIDLSELPYYVAIAGISDVYVALTTKRPYKKAWTYHKSAVFTRGQPLLRLSPTRKRH